MRYLRIGIVSFVAALGALGCSGEADPGAGGGGEPVVAAAYGDPKGDTGDKNKRLDDFQIATVIHVVNKGEIREARFALKRATRTDVQDFAAQMVTEHTAVDEKLRAIFSDVDKSDQDDTDKSAPDWDSPPDSDLPIAPSKISRLFKHQTMLDLHQLRLVAPADFDLGYMTKQVAAHAGALTVVDQHLMPSVKKEELRELLKEVRPAVAAHLEKATAITHTIVGEGKKDKPHPH